MQILWGLAGRHPCACGRARRQYQPLGERRVRDIEGEHTAICQQGPSLLRKAPLVSIFPGAVIADHVSVLGSRAAGILVQLAANGPPPVCKHRRRCISDALPVISASRPPEAVAVSATVSVAGSNISPASDSVKLKLPFTAVYSPPVPRQTACFGQHCRGVGIRDIAGRKAGVERPRTLDVASRKARRQPVPILGAAWHMTLPSVSSRQSRRPSGGALSSVVQVAVTMPCPPSAMGRGLDAALL